MEKVRCKFTCNKIEVEKGWSEKAPFVYTYKLAAVYGEDNSENAKFWEATPNGEFSMVCSHQKDLFIPGEEYYIDIIPAKSIAKLETPVEKLTE